MIPYLNTKKGGKKFKGKFEQKKQTNCNNKTYA